MVQCGMDGMDDLNERFITPPDAARLLGIRRSSVYHLATKGVLTSVRVGEHTLYERRQVETLAAQGPRRRGRPRKRKGADDAR